MFLTNMTDEGITILPTHRLIREVPEDIHKVLSEHFQIETVTGDFNIAQTLSGRKNAFGFFRKQEKVWHILTYGREHFPAVRPELQNIDVVILHEVFFKEILKTQQIDYEMDVKTTLDKVNHGEFAAAFFLNPSRVEDVEKAGFSSTRLPPKSTYFYPKLLTGLVLNKWESSGR